MKPTDHALGGEPPKDPAGTRLQAPVAADAKTHVRFPNGLPGFEHETGFTLVEHSGLEPIVMLQSGQSAGLCFLAISVESIAADYEVALTQNESRLLNLSVREPALLPHIACLALLTVTEQGTATANLLAPVLINRETKVGIQAVRSDTKYSHQHPIRTETPHAGRLPETSRAAPGNLALPDSAPAAEGGPECS